MLLRVTLALMLAYLGLAAGLALVYDPQFLLNDAIALVVFAAVLIGLFIYEHPMRRRH